MAWRRDKEQPYKNFNSNLSIINTLLNLTSNHKLFIKGEDEDNPGDVQQVPFSLGIKGPATLRGRTTVYKVTR